jgi:DNA-binding PadR family transcriptional regulator
MEGSDFKGSQLTTLILAVVRCGSLHGYQIAREIERRSDGYFACKEGTLYPLLHKLEHDGLLRSDWRASGEQRRRRYYTITPAGMQFLAHATSEWRTFTARLLGVIEGA